MSETQLFDKEGNAMNCNCTAPTLHLAAPDLQWTLVDVLDPKAFPTWHAFICLLGSLENVPLWLEQVLALCCLPNNSIPNMAFPSHASLGCNLYPTHIVGFRV
jgi:hypothetical protein